MEIKRIRAGYLQTNCYIVTEEGQMEAVIIDPGIRVNLIRDYLKEKGKTASTVLLTHGHFDHILSVKDLQDMGARVYIHGLDADMLVHNKSSLAALVGAELKSCQADECFSDGDDISVGSLAFKVMHTPGHTRGSSCFLIGDALFSGDTLFYEDCGRTDLEGGSFPVIKESLKKLMELDGDYKVYPGHMQSTTLAHERISNPVCGVASVERH